MKSATRCHFVNPRYDELYGQPCYPSLDALPEIPDTVLVALNPLRAAAVTEEAALAGVPSVIIPGGGVVEGGEAAAQMQRDVREIAIRHGIALLGPNCMGMIDLTTNAATYIGDVNPWLPRGGVAGIAQSGSVTDAFIHSGSRIGFSRVIGCGSEVVLDACDFLAYCLDDPETHSVILFMEGFKRPERFLALADHALELGKPIMVVKVGRSPQAQAAAVAHSGSLAGEDRATDAALRAAGVIRCDDLDELLETAELVAGCRRLGRSVGRGRTGVVTVSTGRSLAHRRPRAADRHRPAAGPGGDPRPAAARPPDARLRRQPAGPVGRHGPDDGLRGGVRCVRRLRRLRRPRDRPRLPVPIPSRRGRGRPRRDRRADPRDGGSSRAHAGLHLADLGRAAARDEAPPRRSGRRADPPGNRRGVHGDRVAGRLGGRPNPTARRGPDPGGLAGAGRRPDAVGL